MADLIIPKGDYGYDENFTWNDADGNAKNLTGYTVAWKVWVQGKPNTLVLEKDCALVVAASGTFKYTLADGDISTAGIYDMKFEATKASIVESSKTYELEITEGG